MEIDCKIAVSGDVLLLDRHTGLIGHSSRDGSAETAVGAATLQIKLAVSPSHIILTLGQQVLAPTTASLAE